MTWHSLQIATNTHDKPFANFFTFKYEAQISNNNYKPCFLCSINRTLLRLVSTNNRVIENLERHHIRIYIHSLDTVLSSCCWLGISLVLNWSLSIPPRNTSVLLWWEGKRLAAGTCVQKKLNTAVLYFWFSSNAISRDKSNTNTENYIHTARELSIILYRETMKDERRLWENVHVVLSEL